MPAKENAFAKLVEGLVAEKVVTRTHLLAW
jgi:hypothetical protein